MPRKKATPKNRPGWGRAINFRLRLESDETLEIARERLGLDRVSYVRMAVVERARYDAAKAGSEA